MASPSGVVPPGSTIGILGGGQLGRMTALAAASLGYRCHVFTPEADSPASQVAAATTLAAYDDGAALDAFAAAVDVVTFEFENVPFETAERLARHRPVRPNWEALRISQDRVVEKRFVNDAGAATAAFREVTSAAGLEVALAEIGRPAVLKTARMGYDGKGQVMIHPETDAESAWAAMGASRGILEAFVPFAFELSVIVARGVDGQLASYVPVENRHRNHILAETVAPARLAREQAAMADRIARELATALDVVGLLAVEMFATWEGGILVNELAPRPHNSGHWTIDACVTSQFEQLVRAICGLPLGSTERLADALMTNLLGDDVRQWEEILRDPAAKLHLYGKREARPGRKMGHVTRLNPKADR